MVDGEDGVGGWVAREEAVGVICREYYCICLYGESILARMYINVVKFKCAAKNI